MIRYLKDVLIGVILGLIGCGIFSLVVDLPTKAAP